MDAASPGDAEGATPGGRLPWSPVSRPELAAVLLLLATLGGLATWQAVARSPTYDEPVHLAAGFSYWSQGDYRLNPEHPPLIKRWAALPLLVSGFWSPDLDLADPTAAPDGAGRTWRRLARAWKKGRRDRDVQWVFAHDLFYGVDDSTLERLGLEGSFEIDPRHPIPRHEYLFDTERLWLQARLSLLPVPLLLAFLIWAWARELYGPGAALAALGLAAFDPGLIAHSTLVTTDVAAACFVFGSVYFLWRALRGERKLEFAAFLLLTAGAVVTKFSGLLLAPILLLVSLLATRVGTGGGRRPRRKTVLLLAIAAATASWLGIWASYGFRYAASPAGNEPSGFDLEATLRRAVAVEELLARAPAGFGQSELEQEAARSEPDLAGRALLFAARHRLLPEGFLFGVARARFQAQGRWTFLRGERSLAGFPTYFLWSFLLKTPLLTLLLVAVALVALARRRDLAAGVFLVLPVLVLFGAALGSRLNIGHRHLLPLYPFLFVLCGGVFSRLDLRGPRSRAALAGVVALAAVGSSAVFYPPWSPQIALSDPLSYFNELAGGPEHGDRSLVDSNLDWGQDLERLATWLERRGIDEPIGLCYFGMADPRYYGIRHVKLPGGYPLEPPLGSGATFSDLPDSGIVVISATHYRGVYLSEELHASWRALLDRSERLGSVGRSLLVFRVPRARS